MALSGEGKTGVPARCISTRPFLSSSPPPKKTAARGVAVFFPQALDQFSRVLDRIAEVEQENLSQVSAVDGQDGLLKIKGGDGGQVQGVGQAGQG